MAEAGVKFGGITLVSRDIAASLAFYGRLGVAIPADAAWAPAGVPHHASFEVPGGGHIEVDSIAMTRSFDPGWQEPGPSSRTVVQFSLPSAEAVDTKFAELTAAGYGGHVAPFDGFWGARYAIVEDPDGNHVGMMSPVDPAKRSAPPEL